VFNPETKYMSYLQFSKSVEGKLKGIFYTLKSKKVKMLIAL